MTSKEEDVPSSPALWDTADKHIESMLTFNDGDYVKVLNMLSDTMCCNTRPASTSPKELDMMNSIENLETRTILSPEHVRILLYALLPRLQREEQLKLLDSIGKMLGNRWWNASICYSAGMFQDIIRLLLEAQHGGNRAETLLGIRNSRKESVSNDLNRYKLWLNLIGLIGRHQCSATDLRSYFKLLRVAIEKGKNEQLDASLRALATMAHEDYSRGFSSYFLLGDDESGLCISQEKGEEREEMIMFPSSAFTFMAWIRLDKSPKFKGDDAHEIVNRLDSRMSSRIVTLNRHSKRARGYLYHFEGKNGGKAFCELCPAVRIFVLFVCVCELHTLFHPSFPSFLHSFLTRN